MKKKKSIFCLFVIAMILLLPSDNAYAAKFSSMSGKQIINTLIKNGFPICDYNIYTTNKTDPNHLIGKPNQYKCKIDFWDRDYLDDYIDYSGTIEIFKNSADASKRAKYIKSIYNTIPSFAMRMYQYSNILVRVDYSISPKRAKYYKNAFSDMAKGKTPKFPLSINQKKTTIYTGETCALKLNVPSKKAKWKSSNKKVATVSSNGKVKAKRVGSTTISAKYNGYTVKCKVTVRKAPKKVNLNGLLITTVHWYEEADSVTFRIKNNTEEPVTIHDIAYAYDDNYTKIKTMENPYEDDVAILPNQQKEVTFLDLTFSGIIYYTQRITFTFDTGGKPYTCRAEYSYDNKAPYEFSYYQG